MNNKLFCTNFLFLVRLKKEYISIPSIATIRLSLSAADAQNMTDGTKNTASNSKYFCLKYWEKTLKIAVNPAKDKKLKITECTQNFPKEIMLNTAWTRITNRLSFNNP